jgi:carbonic anhydrase
MVNTLIISAASILMLLSSASAKEAHPPAATDGLSPEQSWASLKDGNKRFVSGTSKHPNQSAEFRQRLTEGQKPHTIILSCSDSRVPPELVFDQGLGQVFTIRVAGNIIDPATVASIEYAVEHLGSKLIVVMGHESCGAVKAALTTPAGKSAGSRDLDTLVGAVRANIAGDGRASTSDSKTLRGPVRANVNAVVQDLAIRSKIIRARLDRKELVVLPALYSLETGMVEFWNTGSLSLSDQSIGN